jgi:hypothetical protein
VWLWHMVASFLVPDASGNTISWMYLPQLREEWENIALYSWGSATLAWLYHQLCEACRRASPTSNLGGCTYLLQIWIWERIPIGRTHRKPVPVSVARLASIYAIQLYALSLMLSMLVFCFYRHGRMKIRALSSATFGATQSVSRATRNGDTLNTLMISMC